MSLGQLALERVLVKSLEIRVSSNVFLADEDVGHAALVGQLCEGVLDV